MAEDIEVATEGVHEPCDGRCDHSEKRWTLLMARYLADSPAARALLNEHYAREAILGLPDQGFQTSRESVAVNLKLHRIVRHFADMNNCWGRAR